MYLTEMFTAVVTRQKDGMNHLIFLLTGCVVFATLANSGGGAAGQQVTGIQVPAGFQVTKFAGDDLATNIFSMALDPAGRVVVSGPGYVRRLIDRDGDGRADAGEEILKLKQGAQGMHFEKKGGRHHSLFRRRRGPLVSRRSRVEVASPNPGTQDRGRARRALDSTWPGWSAVPSVR